MMTSRRSIPISRGGTTERLHRVRARSPRSPVLVGETEVTPTIKSKPEIIIRRPETVRVKETEIGTPPAFTEMQRSMEDELERRRKDWEKEVERMQHDFFQLKSPSAAASSSPSTIGIPTTTAALSDDEFDNVGRNVTVLLGSSPARTGHQSPLMTSHMTSPSVIDVNNAKTNVFELADGSRVYRLRFDVSGFDPSEVKVKADGQKLFVSAWQEIDHGNGHKSTKQFNRQIDLPENVNPDSLNATVGADGYLNIEGPLNEQQAYHQQQQPSAAEPLVAPPHYDSVVRKRSPPPPSAAAHSINIPTMSSPPPTATTISSVGRYGVGSPMVVNVNDARKLKMSVDLGPEFKPQEVTVKLIGTKIQVHARHEETVGGRTSKREFSREFDLPERLEESTLCAVLSTDGRLVIGASVLSNQSHLEASDSVSRDLPIDGRPVRVVII